VASTKENSVLIVYPNIDQLPFKSNNTSASINPKLAEVMEAVPQPDCVTACIGGTQSGAGALISTDSPVPELYGAFPNFLKVVWQIRPSKVAVKQAHIFERDSIVINPASPTSSATPVNWYDGSVQKQQSSGMWQIDRVASTDADGKHKYAWQDTGYAPPPLEPDVWTTVIVIYKFDWLKQTTSVLSIQQGDDKPFLIPASLQNIPANPSNWSNGSKTPFLHTQIQECGAVANFAYETDNRLTAYWSDNHNFV
jgi:hypothetical protein